MERLDGIILPGDWNHNTSNATIMHFHETQLDLDFPQQSKVEMKESEHEVGVYQNSLFQCQLCRGESRHHFV